MGTGADMNRVAFGKRLNAIRREQQVSSEKLSELCGINAVFVRQIESASRLPSLPVFVRLCNELRVLPNYLLTDSLLWNNEDEIVALDKKLRALTPREFSAVMGTINTLIAKLSVMEEQG
jgi:transcriptional regulator with XRE-family HTH domain